MGKLLPYIGVATSIWGGISSLREAREEERNWRIALSLAGAAISIALAVSGAVDAARDAKAEKAGL